MSDKFSCNTNLHALHVLTCQSIHYKQNAADDRLLYIKVKDSDRGAAQRVVESSVFFGYC